MQDTDNTEITDLRYASTVKNGKKSVQSAKSVSKRFLNLDFEKAMRYASLSRGVRYEIVYNLKQ